MSKKKLILVVDDDAAIRELIEEALVDEGYVVINAEDGQNALSILKCNKFNLIISDVHMPNMDGLEFVVALKQMKCETPVIAISGDKKDDSLHSPLRNLEKYGKATILEKPFDINHLIETVEKVLS